jgi:three-Cys-motif partner protein
MHVRLNDLDSNVVARLDSRVVHYRSGHAPTENVDIVVSQGRAESQILAIAREARSRKGFTLLFVDPFGIPPDLAVLSTAATACGWNEMLVNLDVGGLFRLRAAAEATEHERLSKADERLLDGAFGGDTWRAPYGAAAAWTADELQALATAYAERFAGIYPVRAVYRLWSTGNRIRFMVHLAPHPKARDTFSRCYERSQNVGLFQGRRMNEADRAEYALQLFELARGSSMTVDEIHSAGILPLDRGHIKLILRTADDRGMGRFVDDVMQWYKERQTPEAFKAAQLDLDLGA